MDSNGRLAFVFRAPARVGRRRVSVLKVFITESKYPVRVRHLIGKQISVRFEPDQAFVEGLIAARAVCIKSQYVIAITSEFYLFAAC